jgi:hypothetical protein
VSTRPPPPLATRARRPLGLGHVCAACLLLATALAVRLRNRLSLPAMVLRLRNCLFVTMNSGDGGAGAGVELPGSRGRAAMRFLYEHKAANLRLRQPTLGISDLFAYFLSPAHEIHQV